MHAGHQLIGIAGHACSFFGRWSGPKRSRHSGASCPAIFSSCRRSSPVKGWQAFVIVGVAVDKIDHRQQDINIAGFENLPAHGRCIVRGDSDKPALAQLLLLEDPGKDAVGAERNIGIAVLVTRADAVQIEGIHVVGSEQPERICKGLFRFLDRIGPDLG